ncbi:MAG: hypothetical protein ACTSUF_02075 [Candidatus Heimdallarchaeaceae archaeon]
MVTSTHKCLVAILLIGLVANTVELSTTSGNNDQMTVSKPFIKGANEVALFEENVQIAFNETKQTKEYTVNISNVFLSRFNKLTLCFEVVGGQSTEEGIMINFVSSIFESIFIIKQFDQDEQTHSMSQAIILDTTYEGNLEINLIVNIQAEQEQNGTLILLKESKIEALNVPVIDENEQSLEIVPDTIKLQGWMFGIETVSAKTVFDVQEINRELNLTLNYSANDFSAITKSIKILINGEEINEERLEQGENSLNFVYNVSKYNNSIEIVFKIGYSSDFITISSITMEAKLDPEDQENPNIKDAYARIVWMTSLDDSVDLTPLLPSAPANEEIIKVSLVYSCTGSKLYPGITLELWQGISLLKTASIPTEQQSEEKQVIEINTYTIKYQEKLTLKMKGTGFGAGEFIIWNDTEIKVEPIKHFNGERIEALLSNNLTLIAENEINSIEYYDVVYVEKPGEYTIAFLTNILEANYVGLSSSLSVTIYVNDIIIASSLVKENTSVELAPKIDLARDYYELKFSIKLTGTGSEVHFGPIRYVLETFTGKQNPGNDDGENPFDIPFFKTPKNIAIGLFLLFDIWLLLGIFMRLYRSRKMRKSEQYVENDEFILELAQLSDMN